MGEALIWTVLILVKIEKKYLTNPINFIEALYYIFLDI